MKLLEMQVYKKPTDYARKKPPSLFTVKNLYLHLDLTVNRI